MNLEELQNADGERLTKFRKLGIYTPDTLIESVKRDEKQPYIIDGLLRTRSVNFLVGDSGLGKTPLAIQIALSVAAGIPVFGREVEKTPVLYCDAESGKHEFVDTLDVLSRFLKLSEPPSDFHVWSPNWEVAVESREERFAVLTERVRTRVDAVHAGFVVVDAFRTFWPQAETKNQIAAETIAALRKSKGVTWLLLHHRRKASQQFQIADLSENPRGWFQESAGSLALVNQSDTRVGVEAHPRRGEADLLMAGFIRGTGPFVPFDLARVADEDGTPIGYRLLTGVSLLNADDRALFQRLPARFRFKDVQVAMGGSSASNATRFNKKCLSLQVIKKDGSEYVKAEITVEGMEHVECPSTTTPSTPSTPVNGHAQTALDVAANTVQDGSHGR
jgi:KaiC/GvpD/RAD55 family RecA-like ATPase